MGLPFIRTAVMCLLSKWNMGDFRSMIYMGDASSLEYINTTAEKKTKTQENYLYGMREQFQKLCSNQDKLSKKHVINISSLFVIESLKLLLRWR